MARMTGVIFSDLGLASSFMTLDWVQQGLERSLGFSPFPATLNVRPRGLADEEVWRRVKTESSGVPMAPGEGGFCSARLYPIEILSGSDPAAGKISGAVMLPEVKDYPSDKIEIVAPVRLKDHLGVCDGDPLTWEFLN
jgi:CTP-dependent riboflavin kinase